MKRARAVSWLLALWMSATYTACGGATASNAVDAGGGAPSSDANDDVNHLCAPGTCMLFDGGPCEAPTGPRGNACCTCGGDTCASFCTCTAPDTPIATPDGYRPIASLQVGDLVYSENGKALQAVPILETSRVRVERHAMMRTTLSNGIVLRISAHHPTADGRFFGNLAKGDPLDQLTVVDVAVVPFEEPFTYDILPDSNTGTYVAGGALVGSTLMKAAY